MPEVVPEVVSLVDGADELLMFVLPVLVVLVSLLKFDELVLP